MSEIMLENYLSKIQPDEIPPYLTEGIRDFIDKFDRKKLKNTVEKLHLALNKNDKNALKDVSRNFRGVKKVPKYKEMREYSKKVQEDNPELEAAFEMSKRVIKNTFKIKDKAKLEILGNAIASAAWVKSKGKRNQIVTNAKVVLQSIGTRVSSIYDTGVDEDLDQNSVQAQIIQASNKQQKLENIVVFTILAVLVGAFMFAGIVIWTIITSKIIIFFALIITLLALLGKILG